MLNTHFDKERLIITCKESGGSVNYSYEFFREGFEEWAAELDIFIADTHHLERYLVECGYNVVEITELEGENEMKELKKVIIILRNFPMVDEDYILGSTEDGKYFFSWNWDIEELPTKEVLDGESGVKYFDTLKEAAQDMKETIEASKHLLNDEDVQEVLKELDNILTE